MARIKDLITFKLSHRILSIIFIIFMTLCVCIIIVTSSRVSPEYTISKIFITQKRFDSLTKYNVPSSTPLTTEVYIGDEKLIYDVIDNSFYYSHIDGDDFGKETLHIDTEDYPYIESVKGNYIHAAILNSNAPKLILYNSDSISVSNFIVTTLPVINISISVDTALELGLDETFDILDYAPGYMTLYDNQADFNSGKRTTNSPIKIHRRGGTTVDFPQKSYRFTLLESANNFGNSKNLDLLGIRNDDDWILYSAYSDYEKVRTAFSMNLWNMMSAENNEWNAPASNQYKYVELFFNGRYHGLYALTHPIDKKAFKITAGEALFKKSDWSETEFALDLEPMYEDNPDLLWLPGYTVKEGSELSYSMLHSLYYNMAYSNSPDIIRESVDIDNSIDLWIFYKLTQAVDNVYGTGVKNLFAATKSSDTGYEGYKLLFSPWDMDQTWGNRYVDGEGHHGISSYYTPTDYDLTIDWGAVPFLINSGDPEIINQVKARYIQLRETVLSDENLDILINQYEADIYDSGAFNRTMARWPDGNYYDSNTKLYDFKIYVLKRMQYMDYYIQSL